jgi:hypothetical protein
MFRSTEVPTKSQFPRDIVDYDSYGMEASVNQSTPMAINFIFVPLFRPRSAAPPCTSKVVKKF